MTFANTFLLFGGPRAFIVALVKSVDISAKRHDTQLAFQGLDVSAAGDNTIVTGIPGRKLRVMRYALSPSGTVNAYFKSSGIGRISGTKFMTAAVPAQGDESPNFGHFETGVGEDLVLNLSGAVAVGVDVTVTSEPSS